MKPSSPAKKGVPITIVISFIMIIIGGLSVASTLGMIDSIIPKQIMLPVTGFGCLLGGIYMLFRSIFKHRIVLY